MHAGDGSRLDRAQQRVGWPPPTQEGRSWTEDGTRDTHGPVGKHATRASGERLMLDDWVGGRGARREGGRGWATRECESYRQSIDGAVRIGSRRDASLVQLVDDDLV